MQQEHSPALPSCGASLIFYVWLNNMHSKDFKVYISQFSLCCGLGKLVLGGSIPSACHCVHGNQTLKRRHYFVLSNLAEVGRTTSGKMCFFLSVLHLIADWLKCFPHSCCANSKSPSLLMTSAAPCGMELYVLLTACCFECLWIFNLFLLWRCFLLTTAICAFSRTSPPESTIANRVHAVSQCSDVVPPFAVVR